MTINETIKKIIIRVPFLIFWLAWGIMTYGFWGIFLGFLIASLLLWPWIWFVHATIWFIKLAFD